MTEKSCDPDFLDVWASLSQLSCCLSMFYFKHTLRISTWSCNLDNRTGFSIIIVGLRDLGKLLSFLFGRVLSKEAAAVIHGLGSNVTNFLREMEPINVLAPKVLVFHPLTVRIVLLYVSDNIMERIPSEKYSYLLSHWPDLLCLLLCLTKPDSRSAHSLALKSLPSEELSWSGKSEPASSQIF